MNDDNPVPDRRKFCPPDAAHLSLLGLNPQMRALLAKIERVADTDATVLVRGETGVGKEVVAKAIHAASSRRGHPFVKVNAAALPAELLESELFGHEKGSFTGAFRQKAGKFEYAHRGTLFLDEIGDMPVALQAKLLHVLQDQEFARVGGSEVLRVDVRVIAATNHSLEAAVRDGRFREDLYYRIKVVTLSVPPLRQRPEEILVLAQVFLDRFNARYGRAVTLGPEARRRLAEYAWPGNVRELENMIKRVVVLQDESLLQEELQPTTPEPPPNPPAPPHAGAGAAPAPARAPAIAPRPLGEVARRAAIDAQREEILSVLQQVKWNRAEAARLLKVSYKSLLYKIELCGLGRKRDAGR